ncbi:MAG: Gfo/Idh/MocA family oxidoreductase [Gammaproteobacteria bacterium]
MKKIDLIIIGAGLYVCGKGTNGFGTILPAIFEWERDNNKIANLFCVSTSNLSAKQLLKKGKELTSKTGVKINIKAYPQSNKKNPQSYKEVIKKLKKPACAIVAVPDHLHYEVIKDCLLSGLHTLVVKPFTSTYEEGADLVRLAEKKKLYGAVEFHKRWDKSNIIMRDRLRSGALGSPLYCWIEYSQRRSIPLSFFKAWAENTSILQYLGVHYVDIIRFVTGAIPKRVLATGQKYEILRNNIDTHDSIQSLIEWEMPDGHKFIQTILTNWIDPNSSSAISDQKIKLVGAKGRYEANQKDRGIMLNNDEVGIEHINPDFCMPYGTKDGSIQWKGYGIDSIMSFIDDVIQLSNKKITLSELEVSRPSFNESLISTAVIQAAHKSLNNNSQWENIINHASK